MSKPKKRNVKKRARCTTGKPKMMQKQLSFFHKKRTRNSDRLGWLFKSTSFPTFWFFTFTKDVSSSLLVKIVGNKVHAPYLGSLYLEPHRKHEVSIDSFVRLKLLKERNFESNWWDRKLIIISLLTDRKNEINTDSHFRGETNLNWKIVLMF